MCRHRPVCHCHLQRLWATLAANRLNMVPSLNFLIDRGLKEDAAGADSPGATGKEVRAIRCMQANSWLGVAGMEVPVLVSGLQPCVAHV